MKLYKIMIKDTITQRWFEASVQSTSIDLAMKKLKRKYKNTIDMVNYNTYLEFEVK